MTHTHTQTCMTHTQTCMIHTYIYHTHRDTHRHAYNITRLFVNYVSFLDIKRLDEGNTYTHTNIFERFFYLGTVSYNAQRHFLRTSTDL